MSKTEIPPKGYKVFNISQPHIENLGPGFYKKEDGNQLVLGFFVKKRTVMATIPRMEEC